MPKIDEALRVGKLSYAKVRALTRVATAANEVKLLDLALAATGAQLERICRGYRGAMNQDRPSVPEDRSVRKRLLPGGMVRLEIVLSADEADLVLRADGNWLFVAPTGGSVEPSPESREWAGNIQTWLEEWAEKHSLDLEPETNEPMWDGAPVDYEWTVGVLAGGDGGGHVDGSGAHLYHRE